MRRTLATAISLIAVAACSADEEPVVCSFGCGRSCEVLRAELATEATVPMELRIIDERNCEAFEAALQAADPAADTSQTDCAEERTLRYWVGPPGVELICTSTIVRFPVEALYLDVL